MAFDAITTVLASLAVAGISAIVAMLWRLSQDLTVTKVSLTGIQERFADHAKFIEMILERVLPAAKEEIK